MRLLQKYVRFIRQLVEYTLVAAFFLGIPALAALGPRVRFLARQGRAGHPGIAVAQSAPRRSLVRRTLSDSLAAAPPGRPAETGYSFGPSGHEETSRPATGR